MSVRVLQGHCLDVLAGLEAQSVHVCVTSPPFFGLRNYNTPPQIWDAPEVGCEHEWGAEGSVSRRGPNAGASAQVGNTVGRVCPPVIGQGAFCQRCGAWRGELGQEPTPDLYVAHMVQVFAAVKRVLRDDGSCWINLGDGFIPDHPQRRSADSPWATNQGAQNVASARARDGHGPLPGLSGGNLAGTPWRVAFALQADGWVLRSAVTWIKTSPMPESIGGTAWTKCRVKTGRIAVAEHEASGQKVPKGWDVGEHTHDRGAASKGRYDTTGQTMAEWADCPGCPRCAENEGLVLRRGSGRPTSATELVFLFTKGMGNYFYDTEAVRVDALQPSGEARRTGQHKATVLGEEGHARYAATASSTLGTNYGASGRNAWNWMTFGGKGAQLKEEHYAAYPPQLPEFCIRAGTSAAGVCGNCGAPHARIVERRSSYDARKAAGAQLVGAQTRFLPGRTNHQDIHGVGMSHDLDVQTTTLGWRPTCAHRDLQPIPATVLDIFAGSGTTGMVADRLGRDAVLVELQPTYAAMSQRRVTNDAPLFAQVTLEGADSPAVVPAEADTLTKQERHPNRTVAGFNQRYRASQLSKRAPISEEANERVEDSLFPPADAGKMCAG